METIAKKIPGLWLMEPSGAVRIDHDDILFCHRKNNNTKIVYLNGRSSDIHVPLKKLEEKLCRKKFYRCHRNYIINLDHAVSCIFLDNATLIFQRRGSIPVSRRRKNRLLVILSEITEGPAVPA
jgi:two-component system, LytTR family, response regulator